jgi:hypothetical protein
VISSRLATKVELDTVLGLEDMYDIIEVMMIDAHNRNVWSKARS